MASEEQPQAVAAAAEATAAAARETANNRLVADARIRVELAINASKQDDWRKIDEALRSRGIKLMTSNLDDKTIQLEVGREPNGELRDVQSLQRFIEDATGLVTVVKGLGNLSSAVTELKPPTNPTGSDEHVLGVMRLSQLSSGYCFFDGFLGGFSKAARGQHEYSVAVHELGDLSGQAYESIGKPLIKIDRLDPNDSGEVSMRQIVPECDVSSMIGRSIAVTKRMNDQYQAQASVVSAGVVARASTIESNKKQICSCSGKTLWEERLDKRQEKQG